MTQKELCSMCTEYSAESKCDLKNDCKLIGILKENEALKKENRELKKTLEEKEIRDGWIKSPERMGLW